jgi:hypothetical protein
MEMHGVIVEVKVDTSQQEQARTMLHDVVVPTAKALPGFSRGTWLRQLDGDRGISVLLFESDDAARGAEAEIRSQGPPAGTPVTMESVGAYEVVEQA